MVSVIIPTFNRSHTLNRAIDSVLSQSFSDFELIIVDDGSTDETCTLVNEYSDPRIKLIVTENRGVSSARNTGVSASKFAWLAFLDSDDEWLPRKLESQLKFAKENPQYKLIHCEEIWIRNSKRVNPKKKHAKSGGFIFEKCVPLCLISPSAVMFTRELFDEMQGFDEEFTVCEDYDLWLKITSLYEVAFLTTPLLNKYGGHEDQLSSKYKAMDIWRVRALERILSLRELTDSQVNLVKKEIVTKAKILELGYLKHEQTEHLGYVKNLQILFKEKEC